jgi:hypothetical protein
VDRRAGLFFIFIKNTVKFYNIKNNIFLILIIYFLKLLIIIKIIIFITQIIFGPGENPSELSYKIGPLVLGSA